MLAVEANKRSFWAVYKTGLPHAPRDQERINVFATKPAIATAADPVAAEYSNVRPVTHRIVMHIHETSHLRDSKQLIFAFI